MIFNNTFRGELVDNPLVRHVGLQRISVRDKTWMWLSFYCHGFRTTYEQFNESYVNNIKTKGIILPQVVSNYPINFIDYRCFDWINDSARQVRYLLSKLQPTHKPPINIEQLVEQASNFKPDQIVAAIDYESDTLQNKILIIEKLKAEWIELTKTDKALLWFKKGEIEDKLDFAWEWVKSRIENIESTCQKPEDYEQLLILFDNINHTHLEKLLFIDTIRRRWTQKKYRENLKNKKQCNFLLTKKAISELDKIAKKYELSRTQALEILLRMEATKDSHIRERLEFIKKSIEL